MNLIFTEEELLFRDEVRSFLTECLPEHIKKAVGKQTATWADSEIVMDWQRILYDKGWLTYNWPDEYGGNGWTGIQRFIFEKECAIAGAPQLIAMGLRYVGPVLMQFGTDEQKSFYLPKILSGEHYWAQGFSEPGAGSDLAAIKCKAENKGDHYLVNGSKMWTTYAHHANWLFALVRTSTEEKPQMGISFMLIDLQLKGISIEAIDTIGVDREVNQVFLDNVRVPLDCLVGEAGKGWEYAKFLLEFERGGVSFSAGLQRNLNEIRTMVTEEHPSLKNDTVFNHRLAKLEIRLLSLDMLELRIFASVGSGKPPGKEASAMKLLATELQQDIFEFAVDVSAQLALPYEKARPLHGESAPDALASELSQALMSRYLNHRAATIYAGSSEIQREIIAKQVLGLR